MGLAAERRQIRQYVISKILFQDDLEVLYDAQDPTSGQDVLLKTFKKNVLKMTGEEALLAEAQILKELSLPGLPTVIELFSEGDVPFLVTRKPKGVSVQQFATDAVSDSVRLEMALGYLEFLVQLHSAGWLLLDIQMQKILWNVETQQISLLDGLPLIRKAKDGIVAKQIPRGIAYCSPEQTGRSNRRMDERSNVYSAGMLIYEILCGRSPVPSRDIMRCVHFHMAFNLPRLDLKDTILSETLDKVIAKMTAKTTDARYQSARGALYDFQEILHNLKKGSGHAGFKLAARDFSNDLVLSQELYGREKELRLLNSQLKKSELGRIETCFISGQPGIGKSSLIKEFISQIDLDRFVFVSGKYRQLEQNEHMAGVVAVCEQIIRRKTIGLESEAAEWLKRVSQSVGDNWSLLSGTLPTLKGLIEAKAIQLNLTPAEARSRLIEALYRFFISSATAEQPLVIFFDDIQWFDQGSKDFILKLAGEEESRHIFLICSYRVDEIDEGHPVSGLIRGLRSKKIVFSELCLSPIEHTEIASLIRDSLLKVRGDVDQLVRLIGIKTGGNPFFVKQLLYHVFEEKLLSRNEQGEWQWDNEGILSLKSSSTVIELLEGRIAQLSADVRSLLLTVSCFDGWFTRTQLVGWFEYENGFLNKALGTLEADNYIYSDKESNFYIFHDRIREAAYGLLPEPEKMLVHRVIGLKLQAEYEQNGSRETLVRAVSHLNNGIPYRQGELLQVELARLNRDVAKHARNASAFDIALYYATKGLDRLPERERSADIGTFFDLKLIKAECTFLKGELKEAAAIFSRLEKVRVSVEQKANLYVVYMDLLHTENAFAQAVEVGRRALSLFGLRMPKKISKVSLLWNILKTEFRLKKIGIENVPSIPTVTDKRIFLIQSIYIRIGTAGYFFEKNIYVFSVIRVWYLLLKHGAHSSTASIGIFYAVFMAHRFGRFKKSYQLAFKCLELHAKQGGIEYSDRGNFALGGFLLPWAQSLEVAKVELEKVMAQLKRLGDPVVANFAALYLSFLKFQSGESLSAVSESAEKSLLEVRKAGDSTIADCLTPVLIACSRLREHTPDNGTNPYVERILRSDVVNAKAWYGSQKLIVDTVLRDRESLPGSLELAALCLDATPFAFNVAFYHLFSALFYFDKYHASVGKKSKLSSNIKLSRKKLRSWYEVNPETFAPFFLMFEAELSIAKGELEKADTFYIDCIEAAVASNNVILHAIANERLGRFYLQRKRESLGFRLLKGALLAYEKWGANAKIKLLVSEFPSLMLATASQGKADSGHEADHVGIDVMSVIRSCQIIGNEMDLSKILSQIVFLLIENAGAEKGHIFLKSADDQLILRASSAGALPENVEILNKSLEAVETVSLSLVKYVARAMETVIIDDAQTNEMIRNDMYVRMAGCRSVLCMPILNKGQLLGVIWLENNSGTEMFSSQRARVLEILASQASISFENARLFDQEQDKIRMEGELKVAQTVQNTLFEVADGTVADFRISGSIEPASECGGDWWHYGTFRELNYFCIGDATGHGVPAALITSAVRSAMATVEFVENLSAAQMIRILNNSVAQTSKGQINMTMFLGVYDRRTNVFSYCNSSHEPTIHIRGDWLNELRILSKTDLVLAQRRFRKELVFLSDVTGPALGSQFEGEYKSVGYKIAPGDYLFCYTDGIPEMYSADGQMLGERMFISLLAESFFEESDIARIRSLFREKLRRFRTTASLRDDVTFFLTQKMG